MNELEIYHEIERVLTAEAQGILALRQSIASWEWQEIVALLGDCQGHVILSGCGTSAMAGKKIAHSLNCIERPAVFLPPSDGVHGGLGVVREEDVCVLISKGGNTAELLPMAKACRSKGAKVVAVTENPTSALGGLADFVLRVKVDREPCPFNMLATASTVSVIAAFDAICIALMTYTKYTKEQFAVIHPGGAVGERLWKGEKEKCTSR